MRRMQLLRLLFAVTIVKLLPALGVEGDPVDQKYPPGDVRNCAGMPGRGPNNTLLRMSVLPGLGFDNLRNLDMGQILDFNYSTCQVSGDGLFLLPDNVYLIPIQQSKVDVFAETFDSFQDYRSEMAVSVNLQFKYNGMFSSIGGSFSTDYQDTKSKMVNDKSTSTRVSIRYKLYTAQMQVDAQLHRTFMSRLMDIAANIQNNNTKLAHYLAELLVRDYGTHVITSVDAGAGLSQTTFVSDDYLKDSENRSLVISASASASFFSAFKVSANVKVSDAASDSKGFSKATRNSHISTYGGPMYRVSENFSLTDWEQGVLDHLVAIDRSGMPLYSVINTNNVPELPDTTLLTVMDYVYDAVTKYYKVNTIIGCMDPTSPNFNFQANLDDKSCQAKQMNYTFGGIYQTCQKDMNENPDHDLCQSVYQTNPLTGDYHCPLHYTAILLHTGTLSAKYPAHKCHEHCVLWFCHNNCWYYNLVNSVTYKAYWCAYPPGQKVSKDSGMMFGGVYTSTHPNLLTGARNCPQYFYPLHFGEDISVCVSADASGTPYSVPFGGFDSCTNGNALAATADQFNQGIYPHRCGKHYSQFMVTIDEGCEINFCADMKAIKKEQPHPPILPPYHALPRMSINVTNSLVVKGAYGTVWIKNEDGSWVEYKSNPQTSEQFLNAHAKDGCPSTDSSNDGHCLHKI